jgi:hypothetical protein
VSSVPPSAPAALRGRLSRTYVTPRRHHFIPKGGAHPRQFAKRVLAIRYFSVDVATLASDGKIKDLHVIYDTVDVRPAFECDVGRSSWRRTHS